MQLNAGYTACMTLSYKLADFYSNRNVEQTRLMAYDTKLIVPMISIRFDITIINLFVRELFGMRSFWVYLSLITMENLNPLEHFV